MQLPPHPFANLDPTARCDLAHRHCLQQPDFARPLPHIHNHQKMRHARHRGHCRCWVRTRWLLSSIRQRRCQLQLGIVRKLLRRHSHHQVLHRAKHMGQCKFLDHKLPSPSVKLLRHYQLQLAIVQKLPRIHNHQEMRHAKHTAHCMCWVRMYSSPCAILPRHYPHLPVPLMRGVRILCHCP